MEILEDYNKRVLRKDYPSSKIITKGHSYLIELKKKVPGPEFLSKFTKILKNLKVDYEIEGIFLSAYEYPHRTGKELYEDDTLQVVSKLKMYPTKNRENIMELRVYPFDEKELIGVNVIQGSRNFKINPSGKEKEIMDKIKEEYNVEPYFVKHKNEEDELSMISSPAFD